MFIIIIVNWREVVLDEPLDYRVLTIWKSVLILLSLIKMCFYLNHIWKNLRNCLNSVSHTFQIICFNKVCLWQFRTSCNILLCIYLSLDTEDLVELYFTRRVTLYRAQQQDTIEHATRRSEKPRIKYGTPNSPGFIVTNT